MSNRLTNASSSYLRLHQNDPINWYPWCDEAFSKAKAENKPIFLSIGFYSCHWCHVMAKESFSDTDIANLLGDFVSIKVDKEERPDIDAVYMRVCTALNGSGGWPLNVIITPDGDPVFASAYLQKSAPKGNLGLTELLSEVIKLWKSDSEGVIKNAKKLTSAVFKGRRTPPSHPDAVTVNEGFYLLKQRYDPVFGGFGKAPKFPMPSNILFLIKYYQAFGEKEALKMAEATLDSMARGGIFDQIGGGFSRYSTDRMWKIPHFEKMLSDNAQLLTVYLMAYKITGSGLYSRIAKMTADYMIKEMQSPESGFYSAEDADAEGGEGSFYFFTRDEILSVLGDNEGEKFCRDYNIIGSAPCLPNRIGHEARADTDKNTLITLYNYRKNRMKLNKDKKILLFQNCMAVIGLLKAGKIFDSAEYTEEAKRALEYIENNMVSCDGHLIHGVFDGKRLGDALLEGYAAYGLANLEMYNNSGEKGYLDKAVIAADMISKHFSDEKDGGLFMTADFSEKLIVRTKELYDGDTPSGTSLSARLFVKLAELNVGGMLEKAEKILSYVNTVAAEYAAGYTGSLSAMIDYFKLRN